MGKGKVSSDDVVQEGCVWMAGLVLVMWIVMMVVMCVELVK